MVDINDYYLGVILAHPSYFENPKSINRRLKDMEADPFNSLTFEQAIIIGVPVLLKKSGNYYYDQDYSLYENELRYELGKINSLGINLAYVKPFIDYYSEDVVSYVQEDAIKCPDMLEEMISHPYYVMHSKITNKDAVVINNFEPLMMVKEEYLENLLGKEKFHSMYQKRLGR